MKTRLLGALVGLAISLALPTFAQQKETVAPQLIGSPASATTAGTSTTSSASSNAAPEKLSTLGTEPIERNIHWTAYYIAPVTKTTPGKGEIVIFVDRQGEKHRVSLTAASRNRAREESVAVGIDKAGNKRYAYNVGDGVWRELPEGAEGMGNKVNVLVPMITVAAQQGLFPYGSMVFLPTAVGYRLGDQSPLDGYFWIADCGGAVKGNHFDAFVGDERYYKAFVGSNFKPETKTIIYPLPKLPKAKDPRNNAGLALILQQLGFLKTAQPSPDELKQAVIAYQKTVPHIPEAAYGDPDAATTLWFLTQEVLKPDQKNTAPDSSELKPKDTP